jgi:hypothetical protein
VIIVRPLFMTVELNPDFFLRVCPGSTSDPERVNLW